MNRYSNIANTSKFGKRRIVPEIESTSSVQVNSLQVTSINGVSVVEAEKVNVQQTVDIDSSKQDIILLQSKVLVLEGYVYDLRQIIRQLTNKSL